MTLDPLLDRLPARRLIVLSGLAVAATWATQRAIMLSSAAFTHAALTADAAQGVQRLAESPLQPSLNAVSLVGGLMALPGLVAAGRLLGRYRPGQNSILLLPMAIAWPVLAGAELTFHALRAGSFPGHDLVVGAPCVTAIIATVLLGQLRESTGPFRLWSIAGWACGIAFFAIPRFVGAFPRSDPSWPM